MKTEDKVCDCGHPPSEHGPHTTGYGTDANGKTLCWACCGARDRESMERGEHQCLYLTIDRPGGLPRLHAGAVVVGEHKLTNWPGSLSIPVNRVRVGGHNFARVRFDCWFRFAGRNWHGVQYGENTQICHCKPVNA